jgi:hypothetical protein
VVSVVTLLLFAASLAACGGSGDQNNGGNRNPPRTFTVTLNATSGAITHSTNITVIVQ